VASLIDVRTLKWIGFSHFEADECGTLPVWQTLAPSATAACSLVGKLVSVDDCLSLRPARGLTDGWPHARIRACGRRESGPARPGGRLPRCPRPIRLQPR
jgi:hypothetical protein